MTAVDDRVATFRSLHSSGCFVMPNPWDAGSAMALEQMGFKALATTSAGLAWTLGCADDQVNLVLRLSKRCWRRGRPLLYLAWARYA
ncbi:MAG TPA: isocitrate lyase/phosphoenolpyruvate mutase family protein [Microlunatus sp.]